MEVPIVRAVLFIAPATWQLVHRADGRGQLGQVLETDTLAVADDDRALESVPELADVPGEVVVLESDALLFQCAHYVVHVIDERRLVVPEFPGNRRFDGLARSIAP